MLYHFRSLWQQRHLSRTFSLLALFSQTRAEKKLKRQALQQVIDRVSAQIRIKKALDSLKEGARRGREEDLKAIESKRRRRIRKIFEALAVN